MKRKKIIVLFFLLSAISYQLSAKAVYAICPICTIAVGAGLGLSRFLGIDDVISGLWIGGLILSSSLWLADWLAKKQFKILKQFNNLTINTASVVLMYLLVLVPLWISEIIGHPFNKIFGIDKLIFGTALGSIVFWGALRLDKKVREKKGKQLVQFQKVIFPVGLLVITSVLVYLLLKAYGPR
jgi:hypothetical protein